MTLHNWYVLEHVTNKYGIGAQTSVMGVFNGVIFRYIYIQPGHYGDTPTVSMILVPNETLEHVFAKSKPVEGEE